VDNHVEQRRFIARGRVQGVNFRSFVTRRANAMGIGGWVKNLPDGYSVEALAQASPEQLDRFAREVMRKGPPGAVVHELEEFEEPVDQRLQGFDIAF
jgi:acylphosphatase